MSEESIYDEILPMGVGQDVPDFKMETYEPSSGQFGEVSLADLKSEGKWTILVF